MTEEFTMDVQKLISQPLKMKEILEELHEKYPKETRRLVHFTVHGKHLDEELMNEALDTIIKYDGSKAPFWSYEEFLELLKKTNISMTGQQYNEYDVNYLTQMYFADFKSLGQDPVKFICMALDKLHDIDDPKASEYAYCDAMRRIASHK